MNIIEFLNKINQSSLNGDLNPEMQKELSTTINKNPALPDNPATKDYNWTWKYFDFNPEINYPRLTSDIFNYSKGTKSQVLVSENGNLSVQNVPPKTLNLFRANVFVRQSISTNLNFNWAESLLLNVNDSYIVSNIENSQFNSAFTPIFLNSGWSTIDIFIYSSSGNQNFTINNMLGSVIDVWGPPSINAINYPSGFGVIVDTDAFGKKVPNTNVLTWEQSDSSYTLGYKAYRRGPYNSGSNPPVIINNLSSGYYISGFDGIRDSYGRYPDVYYTVTAENLNGETLGSTEIKLSKGVLVSGVSFFSGLAHTHVDGTLFQTLYTYDIFSRTSTSKYIEPLPQGRILVANTGNAVLLSWMSGTNLAGYDIYRYSGLLTENNTYNSGLRIATLNNTTMSFLDSGIVGSMVTGIIPIFNNNRSIEGEPSIYYTNNSYDLRWSGIPTVSGTTFYNIYRTFYSGIYGKNSYVTTTTGLRFIDSGIYESGLIAPTFGYPPQFQDIATINYGTSVFKDVGLVTNRAYNYYLTSFDYNYIESYPTPSITIMAGDPFAPNTPSGITVISLNGFATIGWQNGVEPDLEGTIIYGSDDNVNFSEFGRVIAPTDSFIDFIGYSGSTWFKLANFDTSNNVSPLSTAQQASGIMVVDQIQLKRFSLLSTTDIDLDYYLPTGVNYNITNPAGTKMQGLPQMTQVFPVVKTNMAIGWSEEFIGIFNERANPYERLSAHGPFTNTSYNLNLSGISSGVGAAILNTPVGIFFNLAYYSGTSPRNLCLNSFELNPSTNIARKVSTGQTVALNLGNVTDVSFNANGVYGPTKPVVVSHANNLEKNVIVYISGTRFGFVSFDMSGIINGNIDCWPKTSGLSYLTAESQFDADIDNDGNIHVVYNEGGGLVDGDAIGLHWIKFSYTTGVSGGVTDIGGGYQLGHRSGCLIVRNDGFPEYTQPRIFVDTENTLNIFCQQSNADNQNTFYYAKAAVSGYNLMVKPATIFTLPFREDYYNTSYNPSLERVYTNYSFSTGVFGFTPSGYQLNRLHMYKPGGYRRRHDYERFNDSSLYQILQSIVK